MSRIEEHLLPPHSGPIEALGQLEPAACPTGRGPESRQEIWSPPAAAPRGRGLRSKFLVINLSVVLLSAALLFGVWEFFLHARALNALERKVDEVVAIQSSILAVPVWNLEVDRIELILQAILKDDDFILAFVTDEHGRELARAGEAPAADRLTVTTTSAIVYDQGEGGQFLGELTLVADDRMLAAQAQQRWLLDLVIILLLLTAAVLAALIAFRRTIEIPLSRLLKVINRAKHGQRNLAVDWDSADEMGVVISEFNDLQKRQARYEEELRAARDNLEQRVEERTSELQSALDAADVANKAKSEFLAVMSHELRTPLNGVLGLTDSVLAESLTDEQREKLLLIKDSGGSLLDLLNDLLDLSKIEAGSIEIELLTFDLETFLGRVAMFWRSLTDAKGLSFQLEQPGGPAPLVHTDPTRLRQVLFNLLNNAVKFTEQGGIRLRVTHQAEDEELLLLRFEVIDSGIGIDAEDLDRVFARFSQGDSSTTRRFGGSGLGLTICRDLAELMGGEVGAESEPGKGSTFWFTIRCRPGDPSEALEDAWPSFSADLPDGTGLERNLRILVAEDNKINQLVIDSLLRRFGHQVCIVNNGLEAVKAVGEQPFDLILMDVQMPEMDGCTATERIRALEGPGSKIPIIALTANAMRGDRERYLASGMTDHVAKPIQPPVLVAAIARCTGDGLSVPKPCVVDLEEQDVATAPAGAPPNQQLQALIERIENL